MLGTSWLVDRLPARLWAPGNLHRLPGTSLSAHFCVESGARRTIELNGRVLLRGRPDGAGTVLHG